MGLLHRLLEKRDVVVDAPSLCEKSDRWWSDHYHREEMISTPVGNLTIMELARLAALGSGFYLLGNAPVELHQFNPELFLHALSASR